MNSILDDPTRINLFQSKLYLWGKRYIRKYPWRFSTNPFEVLVSELMLMRTKANQVIPVYENFFKHYPEINSINLSTNEELRKVLFPLGLNWRVDNIIQILRDINENFGIIPNTYEELISIHGIGTYIAGATICFLRNYPLVLIDTNIVKVIGRVCGLNLTGEARRRKEIYSAINFCLDKKYPTRFYYALIDLSHSICMNKNPDCFNCPLKESPCMFNENYL